jgi:anti-sigma factor RsiW
MLAAPLILPKCHEVTGHVSELLDGELDAQSSTRMRLHLAICSRCATFAAELGAVVSALHRLAKRRPRVGANG